MTSSDPKVDSTLPLVHRVYPARSGDAPHPVLVLLHGLGSNELDLLSIAPQADPRLFVVSARAPYQYGGYGYSWYDLEREGYAIGHSMRLSLVRLQSFLENLPQTYPVDPHRIFLGGFSQGAAMTLASTLIHPERVRAAIALSGYLPPDGPYLAEQAAGLPIFQAHGISDPVVPLQAAHLTRQALEEMNIRLRYHEYDMGHTVSLEELMDLNLWMVELLKEDTDDNVPSP